MKNDGASAMRGYLWYRHAEDTAFQLRRGDPIGLLVAADGKLPERDVSNFAAIVSDAKKLGYRRFVVLFGVQGSANTKCRKGNEFGGCYKSQLDGLTWGVTKQVVRALQPIASSDFDIVYDIAPESCPAGSKLLVDKILATEQRTRATQYRDEFGDKHFIMSCGAGRAARGIAGIRAVASLYRELRIRPAAIDVHVYELEPDKVVDILTAANRAAAELGVPFDINETYYDHPNLFTAIARMESVNQLPALRQVLIFPLHARSNCQIDVSAPYDIAAMNKHLGRFSSSGSALPACHA